MPVERTHIIATVNFKGGVGKTTLTWLLAKIASQENNVLVIDADAQMSLTTAIELAEETGQWVSEDFKKWFEQHKEKEKTLFNAIDKFTDASRRFDFPIDKYTVYKHTDTLWFIPSTPDLYWTILEVFNREVMQGFVPSFLRKLSRANFLPPFRYCFFDCPPSFSYLSYSIMTNCDLILVPVNPDVFADRGLNILLEGLIMILHPHPLPKVAVFMNRARPYMGSYTKETRFFWSLVEKECDKWKQLKGLDIKPLSTFVPDRVDIKRSIQRGGRLPSELEQIIRRLWNEIKTFLEE
jgi:chromosome partitioning protein